LRRPGGVHAFEGKKSGGAWKSKTTRRPYICLSPEAKGRRSAE
jgi:hypothetical protein